MRGKNRDDLGSWACFVVVVVVLIMLFVDLVGYREKDILRVYSFYQLYGKCTLCNSPPLWVRK